MGVLAPYRSPDGRLLVDRVWAKATPSGECGKRSTGTSSPAELPGPIERLREWLARHRVDLGDLITIGEETNDAPCE
jgi:hypothetical protein